MGVDENPRQWRKQLQESMYLYIYNIFARNHEPTLQDAYGPWEKGHTDLLRKYGFSMARLWARRYMQLLIKRGHVRPDQLELEGMERLRALRVYLDLPIRYAYVGQDGRVHHVETHIGTTEARQARIAFLRRNSDGCLSEIRHMEDYHDYLEPLVRRFGDLPPVELVMLEEGKAHAR